MCHYEKSVEWAQKFAKSHLPASLSNFHVSQLQKAHHFCQPYHGFYTASWTWHIILKFAGLFFTPFQFHFPCAISNDFILEKSFEIGKINRILYKRHLTKDFISNLNFWVLFLRKYPMGTALNLQHFSSSVTSVIKKVWKVTRWRQKPH